MAGSGGEINPVSAAHAHHLADTLDVMTLTDRLADLLRMPTVRCGEGRQRCERGSSDAHGGGESSNLHRIFLRYTLFAPERTCAAERSPAAAHDEIERLPARVAANADLVMATRLPVAHAARVMTVPAGTAMLFVTHDFAALMTLVAILRDGSDRGQRGSGEARRKDQLHLHDIRS